VPPFGQSLGSAAIAEEPLANASAIAPAVTQEFCGILCSCRLRVA
jgi:hypothetical protein